MYVYFDFLDSQGVRLVGSSVYSSEYSYKPLIKKVEEVKDGGLNQYHLTIKAFEVAVRLVYEYIKKGNKVSRVIFINQNELVFTWLLNQNYSGKYAKEYSELEKELIKIVDGLEFEYKVIKGKDNKTKEILKNEVILYNRNRTNKLDFKNLRKKLEESKPVGESINNNVVYVEKFKI